MSSPRRRTALAALALATLLAAAGCGTDIRGRPTGDGPAPTVAGSPGSDGEESGVDDSTEVAAEAWELSGLTPPAGAETVSAVSRPDPDDLPSYLVVLTTTPEAGRELCDQLGGRLPVGDLGLSDSELTGWDLAAAPAGELGVCRASLVGDYDVQRDVLLAEQDGAATVWLSTYRLPR